MAQQETEGQTSSGRPSAEEAGGKHRTVDERGLEQSAPADGETEQSAPADGETGQSAPADGEAGQSAPADGTPERAAPSEARTEKQSAAAGSGASAPEADAPTQKQRRGAADTSWAEPETPRRHVDVGEVVWRAGNVVATVLRTLALLFALVLVANLVLVLIGVNPANGVAQFIGGLADRVILGFRDLFVPARPTLGLILNSLVAAVFWVFVGELVARLIRFLAARVK